MSESQWMAHLVKMEGLAEKSEIVIFEMSTVIENNDKSLRWTVIRVFTAKRDNECQHDWKRRKWKKSERYKFLNDIWHRMASAVFSNNFGKYPQSCFLASLQHCKKSSKNGEVQNNYIWEVDSNRKCMKCIKISRHTYYVSCLACVQKGSCNLAFEPFTWV